MADRYEGGGTPPRGQDPFNRKVRTPGSGKVRRAAPTPPQESGWLPQHRTPGAAPRTARTPTPQKEVYRSPSRVSGHAVGTGGTPPPPPRRPRPSVGETPYPTPARPVGREAARAAARRARAQRRLRRRLAWVGVAAAILLTAGIYTFLTPEQPSVGITAATAETATASAVAPLPYAGTEDQIGTDGTETAQAAVQNWGDVGPVRQTENYTYTAAKTSSPVVEEFGRVETSWFADAAFLGDSLTAGFTEFDIDLGGALVCGYEGTSPNQIVNRTVLNHPDRGEEIPLDVLAAAQPKKIYILMGTNALAGGSNDEGFLNYYAAMLDALREAVPGAQLYVQSILPTRPEALEETPGLSVERLESINASLLQLCAEKGCLYLDLWPALTGEDGSLSADYAEADGIHLKTSGYGVWVNTLCTHVPYDKDNPYQAGSDYYLTDAMKALLADLP